MLLRSPPGKSPGPCLAVPVPAALKAAALFGSCGPHLGLQAWRVPTCGVSEGSLGRGKPFPVAALGPGTPWWGLCSVRLGDASDRSGLRGVGCERRQSSQCPGAGAEPCPRGTAPPWVGARGSDLRVILAQGWGLSWGLVSPPFPALGRVQPRSRKQKDPR